MARRLPPDTETTSASVCFFIAVCAAGSPLELIFYRRRVLEAQRHSAAASDKLSRRIPCRKRVACQLAKFAVSLRTLEEKRGAVVHAYEEFGCSGLNVSVCEARLCSRDSERMTTWHMPSALRFRQRTLRLRGVRKRTAGRVSYQQISFLLRRRNRGVSLYIDNATTPSGIISSFTRDTRFEKFINSGETTRDEKTQ